MTSYTYIMSNLSRVLFQSLFNDTTSAWLLRFRRSRDQCCCMSNEQNELCLKHATAHDKNQKQESVPLALREKKNRKRRNARLFSFNECY